MNGCLKLLVIGFKQLKNTAHTPSDRRVDEDVEEWKPHTLLRRLYNDIFVLEK
jgi:hypothetical protein